MRLGHEHEWLLSSMQFLTLELAARGLDIVSPGTAYIDLQAVLAKHVLEPLNRRYCRSLKFASRMRIERNHIDFAPNAFQEVAELHRVFLRIVDTA